MSTVTLKPTKGSTDHGGLEGLTPDDDHTQYVLLAGRTGGQIVNGGTGATDSITLIGSTDAAGGFIDLDARTRIGDTFALVGAGHTRIDYDEVYTDNTVNFADKFISYAPNITIGHAFHLTSVISASPTITSAAVPNATFGQFNLFNSAPVMRTNNVLYAAQATTGFHITSILENDGAGLAPDAAFVKGMNFQPQLRAKTSGDRMGVTEMVAVECAPKFDTDVGGTTVDFGAIYGLRATALQQGLGSAGAGQELVTSYHVVSCGDLTASGITPVTNGYVVVYSDMAASAGSLFLHNAGGARSIDTGLFKWQSGGQPSVEQDGVGLLLGASEDIELFWAAANDMTFAPATGDDLTIDFSTTQGARFQCDSGMRWGDASGTSAFFQFASPSHTIGTPSTYAMMSYVPSGAININNQALTYADSMVVAGTTYTLGTGSIADASILHVTVMPTQGTRNQGLWLEEARLRVDGLSNLGPATLTQLAANTDNLAIPTGTAGRTVLRLDADIARNLTGIVPEQDADVICLVNHGASTITLVHDATSTAANRFLLPGAVNFALIQHEAIMLWYDTVNSRWRKVS